MTRFKQGDIELPKLEIDDPDAFELIVSYIQNFYDSRLAYHFLRGIKHPLRTFDGIPLLMPPKNLKESVAEEVGLNLDNYYYLNDYDTFLNHDELIYPVGFKKKEKIQMLIIQLLNQLFHPFNKQFKNNVYTVQLPESFIKNYKKFVNNKLYYQELDRGPLFNMINHYFRGILHYRLNNFSFSSIFKEYEGKFFERNGHILSFDLNPEQYGSAIPFGFGRFLFQMLDFLITCELIGIYLIDKEDKDLTEEKEMFLELIKDRKISVDKIKHKGARTKAQEMGLSHLFLPLDEEAIPAGTPFSVKIDLSGYDKITNIWTILPPSQGYSVIREYRGHHNDYPVMTTKSEPHLLGEEYIKAKLDDSFYLALLNEYSWENKEEAVKTFELINKYPRLKNELIKIGKELNVNND